MRETRKPLSVVVAFAACALIDSETIGGVVFDFEEFAGTSNSTDLSITLLTSTQGGVTMDIYRTSGAGFTIWDATTFPGFHPPGWALKSLMNFGDFTDDFYVANFSMAVTFASIEFGDWGADDDDVIEMFAYSGLDGTGALLDSTTGTWGLNDFGLGVPGDPANSMSVSGGSIQSVLFKGGSTGVGLQSLAWDNIRITPIPAPGGLALLVMAGSLSRRRGRVAG